MRRSAPTAGSSAPALRSSRLLITLVVLAAAAAAITAPTAMAAQRPVSSGDSLGASASAGPGTYISNTAGPGRFPLVAASRAAPLVVSRSDYPGVVRVVNDLQADIRRVAGVRPAVSADQVPAQSDVVLIGTIGRSPLIDGLVAAGKLDVTGIKGKWETSLEQVCRTPCRGFAARS